MDRPATKDDIVGKTITRLLQTEWEHSETFSSCNFYMELMDGTIIGLGFDTLLWIDSDSSKSWGLRGLDTDSEFLAFWSPDGYTGVGATIENVLTTSYDNIYLMMSGQYYLTSQLEEGQSALCLHDQKDFLRYARIFEFFDFWTKEPCIFNNMRAIDVIIDSSVDDLDLWQSGELFLTIGRVTNGVVSDLLSKPNEADGKRWKARFVVPEVGTYRIIVQRRQGDFVSDVQIDESVIKRGTLEVHVV